MAKDNLKRKGIIKLPDGTIVVGEVTDWTFVEGMLKVVMDNTAYVTSPVNAVIIITEN